VKQTWAAAAVERPRRRPVVFVAAAAALAGIAAAVWLAVTQLGSEPANVPTPDDGKRAEAPAPVAPVAPVTSAKVELPKEPRADFGLTVAMVGAKGAVLQPGPDDLRSLGAGETVKFRIKVDRQAYVGVWSIDADGTVAQLFPNQREPEHQFKKDEERVVPQTRANAEPTKGKGKFDWVLVRASMRPWSMDEGQAADAFRLFEDRERDQWARKARGIRLERQVPLAEAVLKYQVGPQ
jgi:hypothetical protein